MALVMHIMTGPAQDMESAAGVNAESPTAAQDKTEQSVAAQAADGLTSTAATSVDAELPAAAAPVLEHPHNTGSTSAADAAEMLALRAGHLSSSPAADHSAAFVKQQTAIQDQRLAIGNHHAAEQLASQAGRPLEAALVGPHTGAAPGGYPAHHDPQKTELTGSQTTGPTFAPAAAPGATPDQLSGTAPATSQPQIFSATSDAAAAQNMFREPTKEAADPAAIDTSLLHQPRVAVEPAAAATAEIMPGIVFKTSLQPSLPAGLSFSILARPPAQAGVSASPFGNNNDAGFFDSFALGRWCHCKSNCCQANCKARCRVGMCSILLFDLRTFYCCMLPDAPDHCPCQVYSNSDTLVYYRFSINQHCSSPSF